MKLHFKNEDQSQQQDTYKQNIRSKIKSVKKKFK